MKTGFLALSLILGLLLSPLAVAQEDSYSIELGQSAWNKTTLKVLVVTAENESWWQAYFPAMVGSAVEQWNDAFNHFANNYPAYGYLADLRITTTLSNETFPGYDVYVVFSPEVLVSGVDSLGETLVESYNNRTIKRATITLSAESQVTDLTQEIYRDTAAHELGHALGLSHSNHTEDLMYPYQDIITSGYAISTLDLYGVALLFGWMQGEADMELPTTAVLPADILYSYVPVNNPAPTTVLDSSVVKFLRTILLNPFILLLFVTAVVVFIMLVVTVWQRMTLKKKRAIQEI